MNIQNCQQFTCTEVCFALDESSGECTGHITDPFDKIVCKIYLTLCGSLNEKPLYSLLLSFLQPEAQEKNIVTVTCFSKMSRIFNYLFLQNRLF